MSTHPEDDSRACQTCNEVFDDPQTLRDHYFDEHLVSPAADATESGHAGPEARTPTESGHAGPEARTPTDRKRRGRTVDARRPGSRETSSRTRQKYATFDTGAGVQSEGSNMGKAADVLLLVLVLALVGIPTGALLLAVL